MNGSADHARQHESLAKRWSFRVLAVLLGLTPFLICEATLRVTRWQVTIPVSDPFVDFQTVRPLFVPDDDHQLMVTAANRLEYFRPESFALEKQANEYRIVCVGGSTVQGRPYAIETSFTTWLELSLRAADSSRQWDVINCGGVSYASYRLVPIVQEMLGYRPDLIILYTGHNEFLEDRSYAGAKRTPALVSYAYRQLTRLKSVQYLNQLVASDRATQRITTDKQILTTEVDALLDYRGGLENYHRNSQWRQDVVEHFEFNLRRIINLANRAGVPIVIVDPAANLRNCPPFKSEPTVNLSEQNSATAQRLVAQAIEVSRTDTNLAIELLERAVAVDPDHAGTHFQLGTYYADSNRFPQAKQHFQIALEQDVCPLRIIQPLHQVIGRVAADTETPCVEMRRIFEELSEGAIPGNNLFFDHVHPTFHGHQVIAAEIMDLLRDLKIVQPQVAWPTRRDELFNQHWKSLDHVYFERGRQRLEGLKIWSAGRSEKLREATTAK